MRIIILASHGELAKGMLDSVSMIIGNDKGIEAYGLSASHHPSEMKQQIEQRIDASPDDEFIILSDLLGGSVNNALMELCVKEKVHVVCGMNLGLVISIAMAGDEDDITAIIHQGLADAKRNIVYANECI